MHTDLKAYLLHIQMVEIISIFIYASIVIISTLLGFIFFKTLFSALISLLIGILIGYFFYSIMQLNTDRHKIQIDIFEAINKN